MLHSYAKLFGHNRSLRVEAGWPVSFPIFKERFILTKSFFPCKRHHGPWSGLNISRETGTQAPSRKIWFLYFSKVGAPLIISDLHTYPKKSDLTYVNNKEWCRGEDAGRTLYIYIYRLPRVLSDWLSRIVGAQRAVPLKPREAWHILPWILQKFLKWAGLNLWGIVGMEGRLAPSAPFRSLIWG